MPSKIVVAVILASTLGAGCHSPENGRPRGGGHGGDAGNYQAGKIKPASKIDATKDMSRIDHYGPGPSDWR